MTSSIKLFSLLLVLISLTGATIANDRGQWVIDYHSQLKVHGHTNVNSFTCLIPYYDQADTLSFTCNSNGNDLRFEKNAMVIPIYDFACGNAMITKDFRYTVKAKKYPYLNISFISLDQNSNQRQALGKMEITMAGVSKIVDVHFTLNYKGDQVELTGNQNVCFSDFGLEAPERMLGIVKVQEDLNVEFNLLIRAL